MAASTLYSTHFISISIFFQIIIIYINMATVCCWHCRKVIYYHNSAIMCTIIIAKELQGCAVFTILMHKNRGINFSEIFWYYNSFIIVI